MKTAYLFIFFVSLFALAHAQSRNKTIYGELGGPGIFSVNFDTRLSAKPTGIGLRVGMGYAPGLFSSAIAFPLGVNVLAGKNRHYFEAEGGASFIHMFGSDNKDGWFSTDPASEWIKYVYAGYRYKAPDGFTARIGFCPMFAEGQVEPWMGISVGYSF
jgi:hypothetical protein